MVWCSSTFPRPLCNVPSYRKRIGKIGRVHTYTYLYNWTSLYKSDKWQFTPLFLNLSGLFSVHFNFFLNNINCSDYGCYNYFLLSFHLITVLASDPRFDVPVVNVTVVAGETAVLPCSVEYLGKYQVSHIL